MAEGRIYGNPKREKLGKIQPYTMAEHINRKIDANLPLNRAERRAYERMQKKGGKNAG